MAKRPRTAVILCIQLMILFCLVSCGTAVRPSVPIAQFDIPRLDNKIPLRAGLYLSQDYRAAQIAVFIRGGAKAHDIEGGAALCSGTEKMVRNLFREVVVLDPLGTTNVSVGNYDVVVTPQLVEFLYRFAASVIGGHYTVQNTIRWRVVTPDGKELYENTIRSAEVRVADRFGNPEMPEATATLKDQFQKAQEDLYANGWWKTQWWKEKN